MRGVEYVVDDSGKKKAVLIDLAAWGKLWEDFHDVMVAESRKDEPTIPWETLKAEMQNEEHYPASLGV
jgi:hypothetical protein